MSQAVPVSFDSLGDFSQFPLPTGVAVQAAKELLGRLASMTEEVFECDVQVTDDFDPEYPDDRYVVFIVQPRGPMQRLVEMEAQWAQRMRTLAPEWHAVRLSLRLPE